MARKMYLEHEENAGSVEITVIVPYRNSARPEREVKAEGTVAKLSRWLRRIPYEAASFISAMIVIPHREFSFRVAKARGEEKHFDPNSTRRHEASISGDIAHPAASRATPALPWMHPPASLSALVRFVFVFVLTNSNEHFSTKHRQVRSRSYFPNAACDSAIADSAGSSDNATDGSDGPEYFSDDR